jgi:anhydro-N-acetylmuramic acid kinase
LKINGAIWALGAMSGTSLDGVDAAMVLSDGVTISEFGETSYRAYKPAERDALAKALGQWQDGPDVEAAAEVVEAAHASVLSRMQGAELVGLHGQTLAHDPQGRGTHQAGDGAILAEFLRLPVVWDFRSADVKLGGQGAPLAPFFHFACAKYLEASAPVAFLNLGGVGNITYVDPSYEAPEEEGALLAFDTGPANAPINDLVGARLGLSFDLDGALAAMGTVDRGIVDEFLTDIYFSRIPPKSLDRDAFAGLGAAVKDLADADAAATLTACCAASVARGLEHLPSAVEVIYVSGGGRKNAALMAELASRAAPKIVDIDETGLDGDMLEAQAFAYLAVRVAKGLPTSCPGTTGVKAHVGGGTVSLPSKPAA